MGTTLRAELTEKNLYYITKHRYYELKHFCLQYKEWSKKLENLSLYPKTNTDAIKIADPEIKDPTAELGIRQMELADRIRMIKEAASCTDDIIGPYILIGVTEGLSYDKLNALKRIPCCKDEYYNLYRKFFWHLDQLRK